MCVPAGSGYLYVCVCIIPFSDSKGKKKVVCGMGMHIFKEIGISLCAALLGGLI